MKISLKWLQKYVKIDQPADELANLIGSRLVEVEEVQDFRGKYKNIFIVKVATCEKIEGTHLNLCQIDNGTEKVQVVCGAPNVHAGMIAVWIAPGAIIPQTFGTDEPFQISTRKLKGYESNGMLASAAELDLGDNHEGIVELSPDTKFGVPFADIFPVEDVIFDIENKSLTHRPDCFGIIGFAREIAGITGQKFSETAVATQASGSTIFGENSFFGGPVTTGATQQLEPKELDTPPIEISLNQDLCPRYSVALLDNFTDEPEKYLDPEDIQLIYAGMRPISRIVDVTNLIMLETGQPLHAFDYDKFLKVGGTKNAKIGVRLARAGETLELLDGKTINLTENDILITSNDHPVGLAGAMGGKSTMIDHTTKRVLLESATFSLYNLRKTSMHHGIFSEAVTRFTKGQPASQTMIVLEKAIAKLKPMNLLSVNDAYPTPENPATITIKPDDINALLGSDYSPEQIKTTLENVGFNATKDFAITPPLWRTDIHIKEDIIEEVARLNGYDNIPVTLPQKYFVVPDADPYLALKKQLRNLLASFGANEILTYSFVHSSLLEKVGQDPANSYQLANSISPELEYIRQSLTPSIIEKVYDNLKQGYSDFALFEMNKLTQKSSGLTDENVPVEYQNLAYVGTQDFYSAKKTLATLMQKLNLELDCQPFDIEGSFARPFEPKRSANIFDKKSGILLGALGEYKNSVKKSFKLEDRSLAGFEISLERLQEALGQTKKTLRPLSKYQKVTRDITKIVPESTPYQTVKDDIISKLSAQNVIFSIKDGIIYQGEDKSTKNISFHITLAHAEKTLTSDEINEIMKGLE